jgi:hypothetical protein
VPGPGAGHDAATDRGGNANAQITKEEYVSFLKRRISATIWELLLLLAVAIVFATAYRIYFSRAVTLTQVCQKIAEYQSGDNADVLKRNTSDSLNDINELCQLRRPLRQ